MKKTSRNPESQPLGEDQVQRARDYVNKLYNAKRNMWDIPLGEERCWEERITPELVILYADGVEDYNPWYEAWPESPGKSPFGPAIAPLLMISERCSNYLWQGGFIPAGGMHAMHDTQIINPCPIGSLVKFRGKLINKYVKKGHKYIEIEITAEDAETGKLFVRDLRRSICQYKKIEEQ